MAIINIKEYNSSDSLQNTFKVQCTNVTIGWSNSIDAKPYANSLAVGVSEVQKNGLENPMYTLQGISITSEADTLSYAELVRIAKLQTGGTNNYLKIDIDYGVGSVVPLIDSAESSTGIKAVIKSFNFTVGLDREFGDTRRVMIGSVVLQESS